MAAQRVQNYLEKHKIGPLFESLMARVIQDTPNDPIGYIIKILEGIHKKQRRANDLDDHISSETRSPSRKSALKSSRNDINGMKPRSNNLAASWSAGEPELGPKSGGYPRPWTSNSRSIENKTWSPEQMSRQIKGDQLRPAWNNDTRVPTHDFDEWFLMQHGEGQPSYRPQKEKYRGVKSWEAQDQAIHEKTTGSRDSQFSGDELDSELKLGEYKKSKSSARDTEQILSTTSSRSRPVKARRAVEEHRRQLQALLLEEKNGRSKEVKSLRHSPEEGTEILENIEELQEEGVTKAAPRGAKLNKSKRKTDENVSVTICARCARIIGGQSDADSSSQVGSVFDDYNGNGLPFDRVTKREDDFSDNFETASEASEIMGSARRSVWPMASDSESDITPRNGKVFSKQRVKSPSRKEVKSPYRRDIASSPVPSSGPSTSRSKFSASVGFSNSPRKGWATNGYSSDNETEVEANRPKILASMSGQPWDIPSDNNSDDESRSSRLGNSGYRRVNKTNSRSKSFGLDTSSSIGDTDY